MNEKTQAQILRSLEALAGVGLIAVGATNEMRDVTIPLCIGGSYLIVDGGADLISGQNMYLRNKTNELFNYIKDKIVGSRK